MTWREFYKKTENLFKSVGIDSFEAETRAVFETVFSMKKIDAVFSADKIVSSEDEIKVLNIAEKRKKGIPLQYILGLWEFMGINFKVGDGVLIPRDDTSVLVDECVQIAKKYSKCKIADLCSGSGCIAISLEKNLKNNFEIHAFEISPLAFDYLRENIKMNQSSVKAFNEDIFSEYKKYENGFFDLIVSNPPYIKTCELENLQKEVKSEPSLALDGGKTGLDFYEKICRYWSAKLKKGGTIAFEIGQNQLESVKEIMKQNKIEFLKSVKDINGIDRVIIGKK